MENINEKFPNKINSEKNDNGKDSNLNKISLGIEKLNETNPKKRNSYSISFKKKVIDSLYLMDEKKSRQKLKKKLMEKFNISKQTISEWIKNKDKFNIVRNSELKKIGSGNHSRFIEYEDDIISWILHVRKIGCKIKVKSVVAYIVTLNEEFKKYPYDVLRQSATRLLNKYNLSIRKPGQVGQPLPQSAIVLINTFLYQVLNKRKYLSIGDDELNRIVTCDETVVYYEVPATKTIDISGEKEIIIDIDASENKRIN